MSKKSFILIAVLSGLVGSFIGTIGLETLKPYFVETVEQERERELPPADEPVKTAEGCVYAFLSFDHYVRGQATRPDWVLVDAPYHGKKKPTEIEIKALIKRRYTALVKESNGIGKVGVCSRRASDIETPEE